MVQVLVSDDIQSHQQDMRDASLSLPSPGDPVPSPALMNNNYRATGKGECHYRMVHHCVDCVLWFGLSYGNYSVRGQIKIKHKRREFRIYFLNCRQAVPQDQ